MGCKSPAPNHFLILPIDKGNFNGYNRNTLQIHPYGVMGAPQPPNLLVRVRVLMRMPMVTTPIKSSVTSHDNGRVALENKPLLTNSGCPKED